MDSLQASRINGGNSALGRRTSDLYPTPPEVTVALMEFLNLPQRTMIWEPAAGEGDMVKAIQSCGYEQVCGTDISKGLNFLDTVDSPEWHMSFDWIITNPPFKLAEQFIRKAASLRRPFAFLLKSQYWHAAGRAKLFEEFPPSYILPLTWRPDFFFKDDHGGSPLMDVMWCVWLTPQMKGVQTIYRPLAKPKMEGKNHENETGLRQSAIEHRQNAE
nr:MAG TPA: adenine-specific methyltransferase [Caudoviricetes sp.]DAG32367.1 MAG TPA: adenine-specific methyltransferase [Caudoviricetes sp.]